MLIESEKNCGSKFFSAPKKDTQLNEYIQECSAKDFLVAVKHGKKIFSYAGSFSVVSYEGWLYSENLYRPQQYYKLEKRTYPKEQKEAVLALLVPNVLFPKFTQLTDKPKGREDVNFWQYPCATEEQAFRNHQFLPIAKNLVSEKKVVNIYVPIPWATYIDKSKHCTRYLKQVKTQLLYYKGIAEHFGWELRTHSVCQHIFWDKVVVHAMNIGINNLHISHKDSASEALINANSDNLKLEPWPLIAVNFELKDRRIGLDSIPMQRKNLLASFIGAHKKHYIDDSRLQLREIAKNSLSSDVVISVKDEWFYNEIVYVEQVAAKKLKADFVETKISETEEYNKTLSNSVFSLCPVGAGPNTLRLWESIAMGAIPVLFSKDLAFFHETELGVLLKDLVVFEKLDNELFKRLREYPKQQEKSDKLKNLYKKISTLTCF